MFVKKIISIVLFLSFSYLSYSQGFSGRIEERKGTEVLFYLNTVNSIENGVTYTNYTELFVEFIDSVALPNCDGFALYVHSALTSLEADYGGINLDLNRIKLSAVDNNGICLTDTALSTTPIPICYWNKTDHSIHSSTVKISYECLSLKNMNSDYFSTILIYELKTFSGTP